MGKYIPFNYYSMKKKIPLQYSKIKEKIPFPYQTIKISSFLLSPLLTMKTFIDCFARFVGRISNVGLVIAK